MNQIRIEIELPTSGLYTLEALREELTRYALKLVRTEKENRVGDNFEEDIKRIQEIANKTNIPQSEIDGDERLNYLLNH